MKVGEDVVFVWSYLAHCSSLAFKQGQGYDYYTEPGADFKYALDETVSLQTIERILGVLDGLKRNFGMDIVCPLSCPELLYMVVQTLCKS